MHRTQFHFIGGGSDQNQSKKKKCKRAKWLSEEALQIAEKRSEGQGRKRKIYPSECRVPKKPRCCDHSPRARHSGIWSQVGLRKHQLWTKVVEVSWSQAGVPAELFQILKDDAVKCCTQGASKYGKLSSGHRSGKGQFSFQSLRKAMPENAQTTTQLHSALS